MDCLTALMARIQFVLHLRTSPAHGRLQQKHASKTTDPYPCAISPCGPNYSPGPNPWYTPSNGSGTPWNMGDEPLSDPPQALLDYDRMRWQRWKDDQCEEAHSLSVAASMVGVTGAAVGGCLLAETGIGAWVCAAAVTVWVDTWARMHETEHNCHYATYPGFNEW